MICLGKGQEVKRGFCTLRCPWVVSAGFPFSGTHCIFPDLFPMRALIQRSKNASVTIDGEIVGSIPHGLLILLGVEQEDTTEDADWLAGKITQMRIFGDAEGKMNLSVKDVGGGVLVVSQFTLHASTKKGNRPGFTRAARPEQAIPLYEHFMAAVEKELGAPVQRGVFGADMQVALINDGPVTIWMDSRARE